MLRSKDVAHLKPSSSCRTVEILGIGQGFLFNLLLTSLKSVKKRTCPLFFGIINVGEPHSEAPSHLEAIVHYLQSAMAIAQNY